jgi:LCT (Lysosomal Cystine Transporter) family transporter
MDVTGTANPKNIIDDTNLFFRIIVANSRIIIYVSLIVGWVYFVAWSISFYPQIFINYKRKSVVGLSFDFMALNFVGHTLYAIFNVCLYFVPFFEEEYFLRFPRGTNPVELNDVFFSIHASFITALTILQCFIYEVYENYLIPYINSTHKLFILLIAWRTTCFGYCSSYSRFIHHDFSCDNNFICRWNASLAWLAQHLQLY